MCELCPVQRGLTALQRAACPAAALGYSSWAGVRPPEVSRGKHRAFTQMAWLRAWKADGWKPKTSGITNVQLMWELWGRGWHRSVIPPAGAALLTLAVAEGPVLVAARRGLCSRTCDRVAEHLLVRRLQHKLVRSYHRWIRINVCTNRYAMNLILLSGALTHRYYWQESQTMPAILKDLGACVYRC